jgi:protein-disulfide isomerase
MKRAVASCVLFVLISVGLAVGKTPAQTDPEKPAGDAGDELILKQLEALRKELRALRAEMGQLRKSVNEIHRAAVRPKAPPSPTTVRLDGDAVMGSPDAKVAIVEFSDFQCPYCLRFHSNTFPQLKENYIDSGKVQYIFRDFPLKQIHPKAVEASVAANCGGLQGKYWEMHHGLFINQRRLGPELYNELATSTGLDLEAFEACMEDPEQVTEVEKDLAYGQSVGIRGTPHYFVGRIEGDQIVDVKPLSGAQAYQAFANIIDPLLQ